VLIITPENTWPKRGGTTELLYNLATGMTELGLVVYFASYINRYQTAPLPNFRQFFYQDYARSAKNGGASWRAARHVGRAVDINLNVLRMNCDPQFLRFLCGILNGINPDVVLIGTCWPAAAAVAASRTYGVPTVQYLNAIESDPSHGLSLPNRLMARLLEDRGISASTKTTLVSEEDKKILVARGVERSKLEIVPNCVDYEKYQRVEEKDTESVRRCLGVDGAPLVAFVGGLDYPPNKTAVRRIRELIAPRVTSRLPSTKFLVIGPHPPMEYHHHAIVFTGALYDHELASHISAADVCIAPVDWGTGTRIKILEYFSAGKAVVSTPIGALGIEASNGKDIIIEGDYERFCDGLIGILQDPERRRIIGANAKQIARTYSRKVVARKMAEVLSSASLAIP
jgi:glycosyltransferase involved in cell wall biosynthesis